MEIQPRDLEILLWILHMKFATLEDITRVFFKGCNPERAPYRRLLKLKDEGLVDLEALYRNPKGYYVATWKTVRYLRSLGFQYVPALVKNGKFFLNYEHDRELIELRIFARELGLGLWIPERVIRSVKPRGASPDAVLYNFERQYAVEYEHSKKETKRYRDIFNRYQEKEKYDAALYIFQTEAQLQRLRKNLGSAPKKIYFTSKEKLFGERGQAVFESFFNTLPVKGMLYYSFKEGTMEDLDIDDLRKLVQSRDPEEWKQRKPFISYGRGGGRRNRDGHGDLGQEEEANDHSDYYPAIYPKEVNEFSQEEGDESSQQDLGFK